jgi:hypothetical protein
MGKVFVPVLIELEKSDADLKDCEFLGHVLEPVIRPLEGAGEGKSRGKRRRNAVNTAELQVDGHKVCGSNLRPECSERVPEVVFGDVSFFHGRSSRSGGGGCGGGDGCGVGIAEGERR